jgi:hypothetical protein
LPATPAATAEKAGAPAPLPSPVPQRTRLAWGLLGGGVAVGLVAGGLALWNEERWSTWRSEDRVLATAPQPGTEAAATRVARQNANDDRLRSIHSVDRAVVGLAVLAGAAVTGAAVVALWPAWAPAATPRSDGVQLTWSIRWP